MRGSCNTPRLADPHQCGGCDEQLSCFDRSRSPLVAISRSDQIQQVVARMRQYARTSTKVVAPPLRNELARALSRWDNEGGATAVEFDGESGERPALNRQEEQILQCLGAAVIVQWTELPTAIQRRLFEHAVSSDDPRQFSALRGQIARFLHNHKNDSARPA